jgi:hypothetical protein
VSIIISITNRIAKQLEGNMKQQESGETLKGVMLGTSFCGLK